MFLHFLVGYAIFDVGVSCTKHVQMHKWARKVIKELNNQGKSLDVELVIKQSYTETSSTEKLSDSGGGVINTRYSCAALRVDKHN